MNVTRWATRCFLAWLVVSLAGLAWGILASSFANLEWVWPSQWNVPGRCIAIIWVGMVAPVIGVTFGVNER